MTQREITDSDNTRWTCVQAFAGVKGKAAEQATELSKSAEGTVPVVCTPSGGAQTVRLELPVNWFEEFSDDQLSAAIIAQRSSPAA
jgi:hypothetical protein